jgi:hypothetical protein
VANHTDPQSLASQLTEGASAELSLPTRVRESIKQATGFAWNEVVGIFVIAALLGGTTLADYSISKLGDPNLPVTLEANATMGLLVLGVFAVVYKMYSVRLGRGGVGDLGI